MCKIDLKIFKSPGISTIEYDFWPPTSIQQVDKKKIEKIEKIMEKILEKEQILRYGENPHQSAKFIGNLEDIFTKINGKELSYNNLLDIDAAMKLSKDIRGGHFAIFKHNNACGLSTKQNSIECWKEALSCDPVSAFGGVIITNFHIDLNLAKEINSLFFEVLLAPSFSEESLELLTKKENRILLEINSFDFTNKQVRTCLNGVLEQDLDDKVESESDFEYVTNNKPTSQEISDLLLANKLAKHSKSNTIILIKNGQLVGSGVGMTSRVDALKHAISKANEFGFDLSGSVMASDAFFPFPDCVEIASQVGVTSIIQPGGSIKDKLSIQMSNDKGISMVLTGVRHFKH
jgi:phosphoribosylaminoimidazolecarboxamide formyltransferase/IMP cyclohydrolase